MLSVLTLLCCLSMENLEPREAAPSDPVRAASDDSVNVTDPALWTTVGALVPSIELPRVDGAGWVDLAAYRGKKVLLLQFASW